MGIEFCQDVVEIALDVAGSDSVEAQARLFELCLALVVERRLFGGVVDAAINLNGEPEGMAIEVEHESANRVLAAKFPTTSAPAAQGLPHDRFGGRLPVAQRPCSRDVVDIVPSLGIHRMEI